MYKDTRKMKIKYRYSMVAIIASRLAPSGALKDTCRYIDIQYLHQLSVDGVARVVCCAKKKKKVLVYIYVSILFSI